MTSAALTQEKERVALSVVVPCFNEQDVLDELVSRLRPVCEELFTQNYEVILINDGSSDRTWPLICEHSQRCGNVVGIDLARNHGHQLALTAGLQACQGDLVLVIDADLQDPPELLPQMLDKLGEGYDVVYGQRIARRGETIFKRFTAAGFYRLLDRMIDVPIPRDTGDFRLMRRRVVDHLNAMPERFRFIRGMVSWVGFEQTPIQYEREERFAGESKYPVRKMLALAFDAITSFSTLPLRLASIFGVVFGALGIVMLFWVVAAYLNHGTVVGWTSMLAIVLIIGSVQLLILGVFGEYLGRMYLETKQRPLFIIREIRGRTSTGNASHEPDKQIAGTNHG